MKFFETFKTTTVILLAGFSGAAIGTLGRADGGTEAKALAGAFGGTRASVSAATHDDESYGPKHVPGADGEEKAKTDSEAHAAQ